MFKLFFKEGFSDFLREIYLKNFMQFQLNFLREVFYKLLTIKDLIHFYNIENIILAQKLF